MAPDPNIILGRGSRDRSRDIWIFSDSQESIRQIDKYQPDIKIQHIYNDFSVCALVSGNAIFSEVDYIK